LSRDLEAHLGRGADRVLPAGVDRAMFYAEEDVAKRWDFVFVGSFLERKGVQEFLAVARSFGASRSFCAVGSGPLAEVLEAHDDPSIDVRTNLTQAEIRGILNASRFLLFPSHQEAFGLVVTESMYCGTPPIVSPIDSLAERVAHGHNGFVARSLAVEDIVTAARAADALSPDGYAAMSEAARRSGGDASLASVCRELLAIYGVSV
jgi:glycosyltransferase involved in cell wall biosynthesis